MAGCDGAGSRLGWTPTDFKKLAESTSQAEYAGSIPVIGSTLTSALVARRDARRAGRYLPGTYRLDVGGAGHRTAGRDI